MNTKKFLVVCSAALAAGISFAGLVDFDNLKLKQEDAFSTPETKVSTAGATYADNQYTLEGELDGEAALVVTPSVTKQDIETFTIILNVGFADDIPGTYTTAKLGFAFKATDKAAYWDGTAWNEITLTTPVAEESSETLLVEYDGRVANQAKARFTIKGVKYGWYSVGTIVNNNISAFGSGVVTSIAGTTHTIDAEIVPIIPSGESGAVKIEFTPTQAAALAAAGVDLSKPESLVTTDKNGQTKLTNFILFGRVGDEVVATDAPKAVGEPIAKVAGHVAVKVSGLNVQPVEGTAVKYVLMGSETGADNTWHQIDEAQTDPALEFLNTTNDRYFKVKAVIEYTTPANPVNE